jgi:hypothetical protein
MGVSVEELRSRVKDALAELEREGETPPDLPPPPPAAAEAPELSASPPVGEVPPPDKPKPAPKAAIPPPAKPRPAASPPASPPSGGSKLSLPKGKGALAGIGAVVVAIVVVVVLLLVLGGGSDSDSTSSTTTPTTAAGNEGEASGKEVSVAEIEAQAESAGKGKEVTKATLSGVGGGEGSGVAIFGRVKNTLALQVVAEGLEPTAEGQSYAIWLAASPQRMLPLGAVPVNQRGRIATQFEVPTEVLAYLANETFDQVAITLTSEAKLKASLEAATKAGEAPAYTGTPVLRGPITGPIIGAAKKAKAKAGE